MATSHDGEFIAVSRSKKNRRTSRKIHSDLMQHEKYDNSRLVKRKVRKGTRSCWECKRRKLKCKPEVRPSGEACESCKHRGSERVAQQYVDQSILRLSLGSAQSAKSLDEIDAIGNDPSLQAGSPSFSTNARNGCSRYNGDQQKLSSILCSSLPSRKDIERISSARICPSISLLSHEILILPYSTLQKTGLQARESLIEYPGQHAHPVLLARYMMRLAIFIQQIRRATNDDIAPSFEPFRDIQE